MPYDPRLDGVIAYFRPEVLAPYRDQPDRYEVKTDYFEGGVTVTDAHFSQMDEAAREREWIDVRFGYRTLTNGELAVAAFAPDLTGKSPHHVERWRPFLIEHADWFDYDKDPRFSMWVRRYLEADWQVDNGPAYYLLEEIKLINGLTREAVGERLFTEEEISIAYPTAENTHRYEEAHRVLYGLLIDGLRKEGIAALATRVGRPLNASNLKTLVALRRAFPALDRNDDFDHPLANVSKQRGRASHSVRPPATAMRAFEAFSGDVEACLATLRILRGTLETELNMNAATARERQDTLDRLPRIVAAPQPNYSINGAMQMAGKTVESVEVGARHTIDCVHQSEVIIVYFTDGSIMSIDTGTNARNLEGEAHRAEDFHVDFIIQWVPPA